MGKNSNIEWTHASWNFIGGCTKKSAGCRECYALRDSWRIMHNPNRPARYDGVAEKVDDRVQWTSRVNLDWDALEEPLRWTKPRMIFVASMSDLFHAKVPFEFIDEVFNVMAQARWHTFQVLTKRPERMLEWMRYQQHATGEGYLNEGNVWIGVTAENQQTADERIPLLLKVDAPVRFVSAEPLLGSINLSPFLFENKEYGLRRDSSIDWVIAGGESGANARPMHPDWARVILNACIGASVPYFLKQWGEWCPIGQLGNLSKWEELPGVTIYFDYYGKSLAQYAAADQLDSADRMIPFRRIGKKNAGHLLDGKEWHEFPEV